MVRQAATNRITYNFQHRQAACVSDQGRARDTSTSSSWSLGPYCSTLDTDVDGRTLLAPVLHSSWANAVDLDFGEGTMGDPSRVLVRCRWWVMGS